MPGGAGARASRRRAGCGRGRRGHRPEVRGGQGGGQQRGGQGARGRGRLRPRRRAAERHVGTPVCVHKAAGEEAGKPAHWDAGAAPGCPAAAAQFGTAARLSRERSAEWPPRRGALPLTGARQRSGRQERRGPVRDDRHDPKGRVDGPVHLRRAAAGEITISPAPSSSSNPMPPPPHRLLATVALPLRPHRTSTTSPAPNLHRSRSHLEQTDCKDSKYKDPETNKVAQPG